MRRALAVECLRSAGRMNAALRSAATSQVRPAARLLTARPRSPALALRSAWRAGAALAIGLLAGCGAPPPSPTDMNAAYVAALARTDPLAADFTAGGDEERSALARAESFFTDMTVDSVSRLAPEVYAPSVYFNDTLVSLEGMEAVRDYFLQSVGRTRRLDVRFLDTARSGRDYYLRWLMTIEADGINDGKPSESYGVSHLRFDSQGRVLLHKDYWDSGGGLYEQLPVVGSILRAVRGRVH